MDGMYQNSNTRHIFTCGHAVYLDFVYAVHPLSWACSWMKKARRVVSRGGLPATASIQADGSGHVRGQRRPDESLHVPCCLPAAPSPVLVVVSGHRSVCVSCLREDKTMAARVSGDCRARGMSWPLAGVPEATPCTQQCPPLSSARRRVASRSGFGTEKSIFTSVDPSKKKEKKIFSRGPRSK